MLKPNHICRNPKCGKPYYACESCEQIGSWKAIACSHECYKEIMALEFARNNANSTETKSTTVEVEDTVKEDVKVEVVEPKVKTTKSKNKSSKGRK